MMVMSNYELNIFQFKLDNWDDMYNKYLKYKDVKETN